LLTESSSTIWSIRSWRLRALSGMHGQNAIQFLYWSSINRSAQWAWRPHTWDKVSIWCWIHSYNLRGCDDHARITEKARLRKYRNWRAKTNHWLILRKYICCFYTTKIKKSTKNKEIYCSFVANTLNFNSILWQKVRVFYCSEISPLNLNRFIKS